MTRQTATEQLQTATAHAPPGFRSRASTAFAWPFPLFFWSYVTVSILWLAIGLLPGVLSIADLSFRQVLAAAPDASWLRSALAGVYLASLSAEPLAALAMQYAFSVLNIALGIMLYRSRPWDWVARLLGLGMVGTAAIFNYQAHSTLELMGPLVNAVHEFLHVFSGSMYLIALLLFPNGKLPPWPARRWRPPDAAGRVFGPLALVVLLLFGYTLTIVLHGEPASFVAFYGVVVPVVGIGAQGFRYRASSGQERQLSRTLMMTLALSLACALALGLGAWLVESEPLGLSGQARDTLDRLAFIVFPLLFALLPLSLTGIVLRYRLWEIDLVINRSLVYGSLTAMVIGIYALAVGWFGVMLGAQGGVALAVATTVLVAILFQPLRAWLQRGVNRLMYGERDDPIAVLTRLGQRLESSLSPHAALPLIVETVAQALRLPSAAISMQIGESSRVVAEHPSRPWSTPLDSQANRPTRAATDSPPATSLNSPDLERLPLIYQGQEVGQLIVDGLYVEVRAPAGQLVLPAAVEVAAYRIASEAVANVVRHAHARHCTVWLCPDDALYVAVDGDGVGLPDQIQPGVGLASMRERAEELGGACRIERRTEGGTRVIARLPVEQPASTAAATPPRT